MMRINNIVLGTVLFLFIVSCRTGVENYTDIDRLPVIFPDYAGITIPPNIAPLNFKINEPGTSFEARIYAGNEKPIVIRNNSGSIKIDKKKWKMLLDKNQGASYKIDVFVKSDAGDWQKFQTIENKISTEKIDSHLAYRLINTGYVLWTNLGIYQRNLENFDEKPILENKSIEYGCINCHSFANNDPNKFMLHVRAIHSGTVILDDGKLKKVDTKTKYTLNAGAYPNWHPSGSHIAYSVNDIGQNFCSGEIRIEVSDLMSDLIVYDVEKNIVSTSPKVSTPNRENLPIWSPDGKFIYYLSAPPAKDLDSRINDRYNLLRIGYETATNTWGEIDTILIADSVGKSISFPKVSPDGKFLMYCTSDNGYFTIHHPQTDLNLLNLQTGEFGKMDISSAETDSYHCFSSTGHWFVFTSKRLDGLFSRPFFSYLDDDGKATKPFVLPQEDPEFYNSVIKNYNIPELIKGEVPVSPVEIRDKVMEQAIPANIAPGVDTLYMKKHLQKKEAGDSPHV